MASGKKVSIYLASDRAGLYDYMSDKSSKQGSSASEMMSKALYEYGLKDFAKMHITDLAYFCIADGRFDLLQRHVEKDGNVIITASPKAQRIYDKKLEKWQTVANSRSVETTSPYISFSNLDMFPPVNPVSEGIVVQELISKTRKALKQHLVFTLSDYIKRLKTDQLTEEMQEQAIVYVDAANRSSTTPIRSIVFSLEEKNNNIVVSATYDDLFDYVKPRMAFAIATDSEGNDLLNKNGKPVYVPCGLDFKDNMDPTVEDIYVDMEIE